MNRRGPALGAIPIQYSRDWHKIAGIAVGVFMVTVGALLIVSIEVVW